MAVRRIQQHRYLTSMAYGRTKGRSAVCSIGSTPLVTLADGKFISDLLGLSSHGFYRSRDSILTKVLRASCLGLSG